METKELTEENARLRELLREALQLSEQVKGPWADAWRQRVRLELLPK